MPILGIPISRTSLKEALDLCHERAKLRKGGYVCFANVHTVTESQWNPSLRRALSKATFSAPDGMPLVWVSRLKRSPIPERVCGIDFQEAFIAQYPEIPQGFLGGAPGKADRMVVHYRERSGLRSGSAYCPPFRPFSKENVREDWDGFVHACNGNPPPVVWIGLGAPKQELWMAEASQLAPETLFLGIGAAFDALTGTYRRAPLWMRRSGLEWLYRLLREPRRLWKRYFVTNSAFLIYLLLEISGVRRPRLPE